MIFVDRKGFQPEPPWMERADLLTQELINAPDAAARNEIIDHNSSVWTDVKDFLLEISHQKCWYSEARDVYNHLHVDHFRPKKAAYGIDKVDYGGYWWLAFQWMNFRVCGGAGNVRKKDKFPIWSNKANDPNVPIEDEIIYFLDPCDEEDILKITFNENGEVTPLTNIGWDFDRASYTIEALNLNFKPLKESRKDLWLRCSTLISETQQLMSQNNVSPSVRRLGQIKEKIRQLKDLVKPSAEFSATARACLLSSGLPWTANIAA